jgi:hypothetical protein
MRSARVSIIAAAAMAAAVMAVAACGRDRGDVRINGVHTNAQFVARDSTRPLGAGDARIVSTDSAVEVAVIGDSIVGGFGPTTRAKIQRETDTAAVQGTGFSASLEKMIKSKVAGAMDHEIELPVSDISDVKYESGTLRFYDRTGKPMHVFEPSKRDAAENRKLFTPADAQAFIGAFRARKKR